MAMVAGGHNVRGNDTVIKEFVTEKQLFDYKWGLIVALLVNGSVCLFFIFAYVLSQDTSFLIVAAPAAMLFISCIPASKAIRTRVKKVTVYPDKLVFQKGHDTVIEVPFHDIKKLRRRWIPWHARRDAGFEILNKNGQAIVLVDKQLKGFIELFNYIKQRISLA